MRDYLKEMNDFLDLMVPEGEYVAQLVAKEAVETLSKEDKELLLGWLLTKAPSFLSEHISRRSNGQRHKLRIASSRAAFASAVQTYEKEKDPDVLGPFSFEYVVNADNLRKRVSDFTRDDCVFVAEQYEDIALNARMRAAFHRAIANKLEPGQTVQDVFTEKTYLRMYYSVINNGESREIIS
jgi:hypothetical protein